MTTSANYYRIAELVKAWGELLQTASNPPANLGRRGNKRAWAYSRAVVAQTAEEMLAFSTGLVATVNIFATVLDAMTPEETEAAALALVNKGIHAGDDCACSLCVNARYGKGQY